MVLRDPSPAISVNIRLCGGVPRSELKGAPWPRLAKAGSHDNARNANTMHVSVRSKNDGAPPAIALNKIEVPPTFHQNNHDNNEKGILTQCQPFAPVFEPPSWAVPGVGLTRLEVSTESWLRCLYLSLLFAHLCVAVSAYWRMHRTTNSSRSHCQACFPSRKVSCLRCSTNALNVIKTPCHDFPPRKRLLLRH